ncbi:RHS repeat domain-containing protein, partial [Providencia stuartii]
MITVVNAHRKLPHFLLTFEQSKLAHCIIRETDFTRMTESPDNTEYHTEYEDSQNQVTVRQVPIARWYEAQRTGTTVSYDDELTLTYDTLGQLVSERNATGEYHHQYDVLGNLTQTQLP